jgi:hypothetical protein
VGFYLALIAGLVMAGTAIFAGELGLDPHEGWGSVRIGALLVGFLMSAGAVVLIRTRIGQTIVGRVAGLAGRSRTCQWLLGVVRISDLRRVAQEYCVVAPAVVIVVAAYVWLGSGGTWTNWESPTRHYANLARGFRRGVLYVPGRPDPRLLTLENPYDAAERKASGADAAIDLSYFQGRYYLYWGPVPAIILAGISPLVRNRVGDLVLTFAFGTGIFLLSTAFLISIWDRYFRGGPHVILAASILAIGLSGPFPYMMNSNNAARIYEAAITGSQFFVMAGFSCVLAALYRPQRSILPLAGAGILWGCAMGTRAVAAASIGAMTLIVTIWILKEGGRSKTTISRLLVLAVPLAFAVAAMGWYNWARFGSATETGLRYQFAGRSHHDATGESDPSYAPLNLYNYLLNPFVVADSFPFLYPADGVDTTFLDRGRPPNDYHVAPITGLLFSVPFALFSALPLLALPIQRLWGISRPALRNGSDTRTLARARLCLGIGALGAFGVLLNYRVAPMRFLEDFVPALLPLSAIGFWQGSAWLRGQPLSLKFYVAIGALLIAGSIAVSVLLALSTAVPRVSV